MTKTFKSFNKCTIDEFKNHLEAKEIVSASKARLIPVTKIGDEVTLTSIFLSSMRLVNEFRKEILKNVGMKTSGKIHVFTEVYFHKFDNVNKRPDGLILLETGGKIKDSALIEVKSGRNELKEEQILNY